MAYKFTNHLIKFVLLLLVIAAVGLPVMAQGNKEQKMLVVLDAGHGGTDNGAEGKISIEKDIVLSITKKVGLLIQSQLTDVKVLYTRSTDTLISLEDRGVIANKANADLFISIHANGSTKRTPSGTETFVMGIDKSKNNMEVAMLENAAVIHEANYQNNYDGYDPKSPESFIIFSFMQNEYLEQSLVLASYIEEQLGKKASRKSRGVKQAPFLVLWRTTMPSVLVEVGFITNTEEEKYISSTIGQTQIAEAIFYALCEYKAWVESQKGLTAEALVHNKPVTATRVSPTVVSKVNTQSAPEIITKPQGGQSGKITYHIQILSATKALPPSAKDFKGYKNVKFYRSGPDYRYYVGEGNNYNAMMGLLKDVQKKFPDAFVVKLQNGEPYR